MCRIYLCWVLGRELKPSSVKDFQKFSKKKKLIASFVWCGDVTEANWKTNRAVGKNVAIKIAW